MQSFCLMLCFRMVDPRQVTVEMPSHMQDENSLHSQWLPLFNEFSQGGVSHLGLIWDTLRVWVSPLHRSITIIFSICNTNEKNLCAQMLVSHLDQEMKCQAAHKFIEAVKVPRRTSILVTQSSAKSQLMDEIKNVQCPFCLDMKFST